jgi:antitoxin VapB
MLTRVFKSGNSLAVRIPKDVAEHAHVQANTDYEIEQRGNTLILRPVQGASLSDLGQVLAQFSPGFMASGRDAAPEIDRSW